MYLTATGRSEEGDMRDLRDTHQNQLVPMVVEQTMRGERAYDATDIMLHAQEILLERDYFMTAETAKDFGLVDKVIDKRPELPTPLREG